MDPLSDRPTPTRGPLRGLIRAGLCAFFPASHGLPGLADLEVDAFLDRLHADAPALLWWTLVAAAAAYQLGPLFTVLIPLPAAWLRPTTQDRHADRCSRTTLYLLRQAAFLLKTFGGMCWAADPQVRRMLGQAPLGPDPDAWRTA
jgi:hypothetical protein